MDESTMQAVLMNWVMERKQHQLAIPNLNALYGWEADLISATRSWLTHEFEIKVSRPDFLADRNKRRKHRDLLAVSRGGRYDPDLPGRIKPEHFARRSPNYFWYATNGFAVSADEIPPYAGWLRVEYSEGGRYVVTVERPAPRLHTEKMTEQQRLNVTRWLSYKLKNFYVVSFMQKKAS